MSMRPSPDPMGSMWAWIAFDVRFYRLRARMSGEELGRVMGCDRSAVSKIETGAAKITEQQAKDLDKYFNTGGHFFRLLYYARLGHNPDWFKEHVSYEARAAVLKMFEVALIPGLFQTPEYARSLMEEAGIEDLEEQVEKRMLRQETLGRRPRPLVWVILTENILDWPIGGPKIMRDQLVRLLEASAEPNIKIRIIPRSAGSHIGVDGAFKILSAPEGGDVAYTEAHGGGRLVLSAPEVRAFATRWDRVGAKALPEEPSRSLIEKAVEAMR